MSMRTAAVGHTRCQHSAYKMTCKDFDHLQERAGGRCEICTVEECLAVPPKLFLDHDWDLGKWAVRGLLCSRCNTNLGRREFDRPPSAASYLAQPWFRQRHGPAVDPWPEPPVGAAVRVNTRNWHHKTTGWVGSGNYQGQNVRTWDELVYLSGPHRIQPIGEFARLAAASGLESREYLRIMLGLAKKRGGEGG